MSHVVDKGGAVCGEVDLLREVVESLNQILILAAADLSSVFYVSSAYERVTGYSRAALYENTRFWTEMIVEEDRSAFLAMLARRLSGRHRERSDMEYRIRTKSGEIRWLRTIIIPAGHEAGSTERLTALAEDITERKHAELTLKQSQAELAEKVALRSQELSETVGRLQLEVEQRIQIEAELRRHEAQFQRLFEANIIGVVFADIYGNIFEANEAYLQMTGYSESDLPLRWDKMTPPEWSHTSELALQELVRDGKMKPIEKEYIRKDGSRVPVLVGASLLDREEWRSVAFAVDLTGRKHVEEQIREVSLQLEHATRLSVMGELLANMAHEIHQPLGVIANYANGSLLRLKKGQLKVSELKDRLKEIAAESMRVAGVVRGVREFLCLRGPERKLVDLNVIVADALQFTRLERREHRVAVILRPDRDLPQAQADRVQITQVLVNLILNATQALSSAGIESPKILISTYLNSAGLAEITIADNGPGIAAADLTHIFERFFTTKPSGLGLGLPISRSITESHGGNLWYDAAPGESALFRMTVPVVHPRASTAASN
jgi:PAS domain S-box-containing protein